MIDGEIVAYKLAGAQHPGDRVELTNMVGTAEGVVVGAGEVVGVAGLDDNSETAFSDCRGGGVGLGFTVSMM